MVKPEKFDHPHLVYHFTVPLNKKHRPEVYTRVKRIQHFFQQLTLST